MLDSADVARFRDLITNRLGLQFEDGKLDYLADLLRQRMAAFGYERFAAYLPQIDSGELRVLAEKLTVCETYFFRYWDHFRALTEAVLPARIQARSAERQLRILSAGCASGEEAHSIAILLRERFPELESWDVSIHGIDVNPSMIDRAQKGLYSIWSLRETPPALRERYFRPDGREFQLDETVRKKVSFEERNLVHSATLFGQSEPFDIVFCRNVTMYFAADTTRAVIGRIASSLLPGGFLFLGHAETLRGISQEFHLCHTHDTFYYRRREPSESLVTNPCLPSTMEYKSESAAPSVLDLDEQSWVDVIRGASERIAKLTEPRRLETAAPAEIPKDSPAIRPVRPVRPIRSWDLRPAVEMLRQERFAEAIELLHTLPPDSAGDPDTELLRAALLTHSGRLSDAEEVCGQILATDELSAGAHYLIALCREHAGDSRAAIEHDQIAIYLDATFAMPRLHKGLLAKRASDLEGARSELRMALTLLSREDPSRILLFGGGFSRDALVDLCRLELQACGGGP